jgi:small GTP-binding protein
MNAGRGAIKAVMIGDSNAGKTTLLARWLDDAIDLHQASTIGAAFRRVTIEYEGSQYDLNLWDTAGQEVYRATSPIYCRNARSALVVFDITSRNSFTHLKDWIAILNDVDGVSFMIVGNKTDLSATRQVSTEEAAQFAKSLGVYYIETSALTSSNVDEAFHHLQELAVTSAAKAETSVVPHLTNISPAPPSHENEECC